jgi:non-specific protein-tyrosine kinase
MELRQYIGIIWRWMWLIILAAAIAGAGAYVATRGSVPVYRSTVTLMVGAGIIQNPNANTQDIWLSQQLAQTYMQVVTRQPVLQGVVETLGLGDDWTILRERVKASIVEGTQLLQIAVIDTSPESAAAIANEVARQVILQSATAERDAERNKHRAFVEKQIADLQAKIEAAQAQVADLEKQLVEAFSARQIQDLQGQINILETQINSWQANYAQLLNFLEGGSPNYLSVIEPGEANTVPVGPNDRMNIMLAVMIGVMLAVGAAFLMEYLDDTIKSPDDVSATVELTPLGVITRMRGEGYKDKLITLRHPRASVSEAYRTLRTNIQFSTLDAPARSLLITSPGSIEGKSTTTANLAVTMAQAGLRTVIIDADLRRPAQHKIFELPNQRGLTNALLQDGDLTLDGHLQPTAVENLSVLTSGPIPPNPSELLGSAKMGALMQRLKEEYDVVLYDSPPTMAVTDASVLANRVDGVVLVTDANHTRREMAVRARDTLRKVGGNLLGAVINRISSRAGGYYQYYYYYYSSDGDGERKKKRKHRRDNGGEHSWLGSLFGRASKNGDTRSKDSGGGSGD